MTNAAASGTEEVVGGGLTLFGVTFTSKVLGIIMGIGGIGLGIYLATNYVTPLWDQVQSGQTNISTKKTAVGGLEQKIVGKGNVLAKIEEAKKQNQFVLSLLPNVDNIDTLMRDIQEQIPKTITISLPPDFSYELAGTMRNFQPTPFVPPQYKTYSFTIGFDGKFEDVLNTIQKLSG